MPPAYESVIFLFEEAQFVQSTMFAFSQNQATGSGADQGAVVPVTGVEISIANSILAKVRGQMTNPAKPPISFTQAEAQLMSYLYNNYIQIHGKPQGDIDWTYYVRLNTNSTALVVDVLRKLGANVANFPPNVPTGYLPTNRGFNETGDR